MGISGLLARYAHLTRPNESARLAVQRVLLEECGATVPLEHITLERGVVYVREHATLKNEIALRQKNIMKKLVGELKEAAPQRVS